MEGASTEVILLQSAVEYKHITQLLECTYMMQGSSKDDWDVKMWLANEMK